MRREKMEEGRRRARDARLVLSGLLALSLIANLSLSLSLVNRKNMTVLVPAVAGPAWEVGNSWAGKRYLEDTARTAAVTLLTLTPENANYVREAATRMSHASARGAIGAWLSAESERMARRNLATAFYPHRVAVDPEALTAEVEGKLATWIGREEASREDRRYRLVFGMDGGRIGLLRFEEIGK
ncbi:MAG: TraE/TraK family type IV conjugative transfer system protein [Gammaproteobacteria bacterium]|nr:TraE/TraK family type IV conjugative transfer system protein [Gammaproteobacteria bacterium]